MAGSLQEIIGRIASRRQALAFGRWRASVEGQEMVKDIVDALETIDAELKRLGGIVGGAGGRVSPGPASRPAPTEKK